MRTRTPSCPQRAGPHFVDVEDEHWVDAVDAVVERPCVEVGDLVGVEFDADALLWDAGDVGVPVEGHVLPEGLAGDDNAEVVLEEGKEARQRHGVAGALFGGDEVFDLGENIIEGTWSVGPSPLHRVALKEVVLELADSAWDDADNDGDVPLAHAMRVHPGQELVDLDVPRNVPELVVVVEVMEEADHRSSPFRVLDPRDSCFNLHPGEWRVRLLGRWGPRQASNSH